MSNKNRRYRPLINLKRLLLSEGIRTDRPTIECVLERGRQFYPILRRLGFNDYVTLCAIDVASDMAFQAIETGLADSLKNRTAWMWIVAWHAACRFFARELRQVSLEAVRMQLEYREQTDSGVAELVARLRAGAARLPAKYRRAFNLCVIEQRGLREAADLMGISLGSLRHLLRMVRRRLIACLWSEE